MLFGSRGAKPSLEQIKRGVMGFTFNSTNAVRPFSVRLGEKMGWDAAFTEKAIGEYRRYLVLTWDAAERGTLAVPSQTVDEVWHFHILDTHSYWVKLCKETLKREIHHWPSEGSKAESVDDIKYRQTLRRYVEIFHQTPPKEIWGEMPAFVEPKGYQSKAEQKPSKQQSSLQSSQGAQASSDVGSPSLFWFGCSSGSTSDSTPSPASGADYSSPASSCSSSPASSCSTASSCSSASCGGGSGCGGGGCGGG